MTGDLRARRWSLLLFLCVLVVLSFGLYAYQFPNLKRDQLTPVARIGTEVHDEDGPVAGARVRFKGELRFVETDVHGFASLPRHFSAAARVTASKEGYLIGGASADAHGFSIPLTRLPSQDAEAYAWVAPDPNPTKHQNCGNCHESMYQEWAASGHAKSVRNRRFVNLYDSSDWSGRTTTGWNLLAEHPDGAGVCTACHAPSLRFEDPAYYDLRKANGPAAQGVHCDYCHKIADLAGRQVGLTHGRFGLKLLRPAQGQLFFGPLDDVDRGEDAFSPLYKESRYCASCHEGTVFGVPVYTTYSEWLQSPARKAGKQCQSCHMAPTGMLTNIAPGRGGIERPPQTLANHRFFVGSQLEMLKRCLNVDVHSASVAQGVRVEVRVRAENVGHRVPTGFADRQLILVVEALDSKDQAIPVETGSPVLPEYAGNSVARRAGRLYVKQLSDFDGHRPVPFWRAQTETVDSRLVPGEVDRSVYTFPPGVARLRVRLLYRRFWEAVADGKGWPDNELVVYDQVITLSRSNPEKW